MSWPMVKLSTVCTLINGRAYAKDELLSEGKYEVLRVGNFFSNRDWYYSDLELPEDKYCDHGDLLYAWSASFGPRIWDGKKVIYHYHIWKIVIDEMVIDKKYLFYALQNDVESIKREQGTGSTMIHVTKSAMEDRFIPLPPLPEQKRIAAILDKADAIHRKRQQAIQLADDFLRAVFLDMFGDPVSNPKGWPKKSLKLLGKSATGRTPPGEKVGMWGEGLPFVTPGDLCGKVDSSVREVTREGAEYSKICRKGSLLVCCIGTVGKVGIAGRSLAFNQQINAQEWGSEISDIYGFFVFKLSPGLVSSKAIQTTLPILKKSLFDEIEIPVPPIGLQEKFSAIAQKVSESSLRHESGLNTSLFESLSQLAFSGQL